MTESGDHDLERKHYMEVRQAFLEYSSYMAQDLRRIESHLNKLPPTLASMLSPATTTRTILSVCYVENDNPRPEPTNAYSRDHDGDLSLLLILLVSSIESFKQEYTFRKLDGMREAVRRNQKFLNAVVEFQDRTSPFPLTEDEVTPSEGPSKTTARQVGKVSTTLHQLMRDWSAEGAEEREQSYTPVLEELHRRLPVDTNKTGEIRVLVPGAGLGRLAMEIVSRGYATQGNEFSYFMLMVSNFVLNGIDEANAHDLSPFIDNRCNTFTVEDMLRRIAVPDVCPAILLGRAGANVDFSMCAGEWLEVYADQAESFDAIVTVFFLDTAPVVIEYIEAISRLLKEGGFWINFGPLLYHWAQGAAGDTDERFARSVELSWEEIRHVCSNYGLAIVHEETREATYNADRKGLMRTVYNGVLCSAVKLSKSRGQV